MDSMSDEMSTSRRLSWVASNEWPQPELSLGAPNGSMDILERYQFWEIRKDSPAHQAWHTISKAITQLLEDRFALSDAEDANLMVEMSMVAQKMAKPSPTILFRSQSKAVRQTAIDLVKNSPALVPYIGMLMASCSLFPRSLVMEDVLGMPSLPRGVYSSDALRHCGVSIVISEEQGGSLRKATLGGIVCIDGLFYGMTTARACFGEPGVSADMEPELHFALHGLDRPDGATDGEFDGVEMTSKGEQSSAMPSIVILIQTCVREHLIELNSIPASKSGRPAPLDS